MLPRELRQQIRRLQIRARCAVAELFAGEYRSVFRGSGLVFEEVREYQPGDDVRAIDWNVTARVGIPFIKRHVEERERTVVLLADWSGSQAFGTVRHEKREVTAELAAVLAFSAVANNDKVGLIGFTDQVERYVPPAKGQRHALRLIRDVLCAPALRRGTSLQVALEFLGRVLHRRGILFILSDFRDTGGEHALRVAGRRHELIGIRVTDPREETIPAVGLVEVVDPETGARFLLDTDDRRVRLAYEHEARRRQHELQQLARSARMDLVEATTQGGHLEALTGFFHRRERRLRRT